MGALAHAVIISTRIKESIKSPAIGEISVTPHAASPAKENPYREARERIRMRRKAAQPQTETESLRSAVSDLLLLMDRAAAGFGHIADDEALPPKPAPFNAGGFQAPAASRSNRDLRVSESSRESDLSAYQDHDDALSDSNDDETRERIAAGLVTFHGGMSVPRVAPFIIKSPASSSPTDQ